MAFDWIRSGRKGRGTLAASIAAVVATIAMIAAVSTSLGARMIHLGGSLSERAVATFERLTYAVATRQTPASAQAPAAERSVTAGAFIAPPGRADTASAAPPASVSKPAQSITAALDDQPIDPRLRLPLTRHRAELQLPTYDISRALTAEQRDSALADMTMRVPVLASDLKPTKAQLDSAARERASLAAMYRDQGRPMPILLGGASFGLFGKSREERRRDSIIHRDNTDRLQRLVARVRARQDSMRRADSIAALKTQKVDSTDE